MLPTYTIDQSRATRDTVVRPDKRCKIASVVCSVNSSDRPTITMMKPMAYTMAPMSRDPRVSEGLAASTDATMSGPNPTSRPALTADNNNPDVFRSNCSSPIAISCRRIVSAGLVASPSSDGCSSLFVRSAECVNGCSRVGNEFCNRTNVVTHYKEVFAIHTGGNTWRHWILTNTRTISPIAGSHYWRPMA